MASDDDAGVVRAMLTAIDERRFEDRERQSVLLICRHLPAALRWFLCAHRA